VALLIHVKADSDEGDPKAGGNQPLELADGGILTAVSSTLPARPTIRNKAPIPKRNSFGLGMWPSRVE